MCVKCGINGVVFFLLHDVFIRNSLSAILFDVYSKALNTLPRVSSPVFDSSVIHPCAKLSLWT